MVYETKKNTGQMKNTEKLATYGIRDEEKHRTNEKYRETGNIGYTKRRKTQDK
jgi:hypothetical protein